jgi:hypothetical protein
MIGLIGFKTVQKTITNEERKLTPLFVFCADLHLEDGAWSSRPGIYGDAYYSFEQIVNYCIEHDLPVILGGDVLEKKSNSSRPIAKLFDGLTRMQHRGVPVYYIQGNHEYDRNAPWLSAHAWPIYMHEASFDINGVKVAGFDWLPRGDIQDAFTRVPQDTDILITHQVWKDFMGNLGRTDCELTDVHHVQTILNGDFHVTKTVTSANAQGKTVTMLSPGSTCMQDMSESPDKFFFVVGRIPTTGEIVFTPVQLRTRRFLNYTVKDQDTLDALCSGQLLKDINDQLDDTLPAHINKPLIRIKFDKQLPDAYLRLMTAVGDFAHVACEAISEKYSTAKTATRDSAKNDLLSALADLVGEDSEAYKLSAALLVAEDAVKELDVQFSKHMTEELEDAALTVGSEELGTPQVPGM